MSVRPVEMRNSLIQISGAIVKENQLDALFTFNLFQ